MEDPKVDKYTDKQPGGEAPSAEDQKQVSSYIQVLTELLHNPKSRDGVVEVLTASPDPFDTVPTAAVSTNDMGVNLMRQSGHEVHFGIQLAASSFLIGDLIHLGYAAAGWEELTEEDIAGIYEDTLQMVIKRGLDDGSIDPIQLQLEIEPMLDENQQAGGKALQQKEGLEDAPSQGAMTEQHVQGKMKQKEGMDAKNKATQVARVDQANTINQGQEALQGRQR